MACQACRERGFSFICVGWETRPDVLVKQEMLKEIDKENVLFVVDDRQSIVDMWRSEGLVCLPSAQWVNRE